VLDDLLDYARIEQGLVYKQGVNLNNAINPIIDKYRSLINDKHQSLVLDLPSSLDIEVAADNYLSELIEMLVRGAHLYTPHGGEIKISIVLTEDSFQFQVSDAGPSLVEDEQSHLFQKYYRSKRDEVVRGSGLDLYLAKRLIELWDGQIGVESSLNHGNTFWLTLPLKKD
jgi:signal transduction histidine kinase